MLELLPWHLLCGIWCFLKCFSKVSDPDVHSKVRRSSCQPLCDTETESTGSMDSKGWSAKNTRKKQVGPCTVSPQTHHRTALHHTIPHHTCRLPQFMPPSYSFTPQPNIRLPTLYPLTTMTRLSPLLYVSEQCPNTTQHMPKPDSSGDCKML